MFGTNRQYTLERLPFSSKGAFLSIYQNTEDQQLYFTICRGKQGVLERPDLMRIAPFFDGEELPYIYEADEARLTMLTKKGTVEFVYDRPDCMRVRVKDISVKFICEPLMHEGGYVRENGEVEAGFAFCGKLLFSPISGSMTNNVHWNFRRVCPDPYEIVLAPEENGAGEAAIYEYYSNGVAADTYAPFDEVVKARYADFSDFSAKYPAVPEYYTDMAKKAVYMVYHSILGPKGYLKKPAVYMHKLFLNRAFGWQQCFHAMAMKNDPKTALELLFSLFEYQNEAGGIPDHVTDVLEDVWVSTKPPLFGYAICKMLDEFDLSVLTKEDYEDAYKKLSAYTEWWFKQHDHAGCGYPAYYHADESGYDESTAFNGGIPVQSPDLIAYTAFNLEACGRLAAILGKKEEVADFMARSKKMIDYLVNVLWDGDQFRSYLPAEKRLYRCGSIVQLQPIMLGSRLPQHIIDRVAERLMDPEEYMTEYGAATEHLKSEYLVVRAFTRGAVVAPTQCLLINGLYDAGKAKEAREFNIRYLNALTHEGLALGIHSYRKEPATLDDIERVNSGMSVGFPFSSWVGSIFLQLAAKLN